MALDLRDIKTTNERRQLNNASANDDGIVVNVRSRRANALPDAWDDRYFRSNTNARNWKHYRKNQWKD